MKLSERLDVVERKIDRQKPERMKVYYTDGRVAVLPSDECASLVLEPDNGVERFVALAPREKAFEVTLNGMTRSFKKFAQRG